MSQSSSTLADVNANVFRDALLQHKKRALEVYRSTHMEALQLAEDFESQKAKILCKIHDEYEAVKDLPPPQPKPAAKPASASSAPIPPLPPPSANGAAAVPSTPSSEAPSETVSKVLSSLPKPAERRELIPFPHAASAAAAASSTSSRALVPLAPMALPPPQWHPPWKLMRVVSGHTGWVRSVAVDHSNEWFVTGSADRTIKVWDLASGQLRITLTGHISAVRGLVISNRHPYLFSSSEDREIKCWDLEVNKVVRQYHGHLSGVYCLTMHPTLDLLVSGGRDSTARVWDIRSKQQVHVLAGHTNTVASVVAQPTDPQVITGSHDTTIRCWDLVAGRTALSLTHHKKTIRSMVMHPVEYSFVSGAPDNLKHWKLPECRFVKNFSGHKGIVNCVALNRDNVLFSGADNGTMHLWDWGSGYCFQELTTTPQPGSLESEAGIFCAAFDQSGARLITGEVDKTIKVWREDEDATPQTHPIKWTPPKTMRW